MKHSLARAAVAAAAGMLDEWRTRRSAWLLYELSDAQLRDIGLTRSDIARAVRTGRLFLAD